ncbi:DUF6115 domain-containing protein [Indiicoccus explosivorum]|uniref:DUF6115 domain-containing protein n=1 Tax=Indiicoccus explosivorum TaxID=1917864 RepID=UPI000B452831|nr:hypothetical protein [Indiicoccus explosivorum]
MLIAVIILFSMQALSFYLIVLLLLKNSRIKELEQRQEQIVEEMEYSLTAYLIEIKEENDRLLDRLETGKQEAQQSPVPAESAEPEKPAARTEAEALYLRGFTIEEIARQLGTGKTEVELLLKFRDKQ